MKLDQDEIDAIAKATAMRLMTVQEVADFLMVSPNWVHRHAAGRGVVIRSLKVGKFRRFRLADVQAFAQHCEAIARDAQARKNRRAA